MERDKNTELESAYGNRKSMCCCFYAVLDSETLTSEDRSASASQPALTQD